VARGREEKTPLDRREKTRRKSKVEKKTVEGGIERVCRQVIELNEGGIPIGRSRHDKRKQKLGEKKKGNWGSKWWEKPSAYYSAKKKPAGGKYLMPLRSALTFRGKTSDASCNTKTKRNRGKKEG